MLIDFALKSFLRSIYKTFILHMILLFQPCLGSIVALLKRSKKEKSPEGLKLLKLKHGLFENHYSITLILGTTGNRKLLEYTQELAKLSNDDFSKPLELNICVGKNEKVRKAILAWFIK